MKSLRGKASWAKMTSLKGNLTVLVCHPTKFVNKAEKQTLISTNINLSHGCLCSKQSKQLCQWKCFVLSLACNTIIFKGVTDATISCCPGRQYRPMSNLVNSMSMSKAAETLLKGKAQYSLPPCTN
jgi:hypothetical protein